MKTQRRQARCCAVKRSTCIRCQPQQRGWAGNNTQSDQRHAMRDKQQLSEQLTPA